MNLAYVRVSTREQNESRQMVSLERFGIEKWFIEKVSASTADRPKLRCVYHGRPPMPIPDNFGSLNLGKDRRWDAY